MKTILAVPIIFLTLILSSFSGQVSIMAENDVTYKTDHYFTHGTRIQYTDDLNWGVSIGQNMYTPDDKEAAELIPYDRPYAGYLYGSAFDTIYLKNRDELSLELQMGMVGPDSYAEETQKWIHEHTGSYIPRGWDNQIVNHFAFLLNSRYTAHVFDNKYFAFDPYIELQAGNLADYLNAGFNVYIGYNLPSNRNQYRVIPFKAVLGDNCNPYVYVYGGVEPKWMMYNMLLEDERFTIHPESLVYDRNVGLVIGCKYVELAFTLCLRSKEFEEQIEVEKYGSVKVSVGF